MVMRRGASPVAESVMMSAALASLAAPATAAPIASIRVEGLMLWSAMNTCGFRVVRDRVLGQPRAGQCRV